MALAEEERPVVGEPVRPSDLIGDAERARIDAAVRAAEEGTSGEIVVAVVRSCRPWDVAGWRCAALFALVALAATALWPEPVPVGMTLLLQLAAGSLAFGAVRVPFVARAFLTDNALRDAADMRAAAMFSEHGLGNTAGRTGVLILVALFEHRVVVLADEAVNEALEPGESWTGIVDGILARIREGRAVDGLVEAIAACGVILSHPLPSAHDDEDEITRTLVLED